MKIIVNGIEQENPCKKEKLDKHFTPAEIKKIVQDKQKEVKEKEENAG
jgi:hypothetical protein